MAAQVEVQSGEVGRTGLRGRMHLSPLTDTRNKGLSEGPSGTQGSLIFVPEPTKPVPGTKPRLTPKPFVIERNPTIRPILAPKPHSKPQPECTHPAGFKPDPPSTPKQLKSRPVLPDPTRPSPSSFKQSAKLSTGQTTKPVVHPFKPAPPLSHGDSSRPTPPKPLEWPKPCVAGLSFSRSPKKSPAAEWSGTTKKDEENDKVSSKSQSGTSMTRAKSMGFLNQLGQEEKLEEIKPQAVAHRLQPRGSRSRPVSAIFFPSSSSSSEPQVPSPRWEGRRPLSADLTARFESIGFSLHRKNPSADCKENTPELRTPTSLERLSSLEGTTTPLQGAAKPIFSQLEGVEKKKVVEIKNEDDVARASSIKRRMSLLLDPSSSSPPATSAIDPVSSPQPIVEPEAATLGIKQRIKKLTEEVPPVPSYPVKPTVKPRSLPLDRTTRFLSEKLTDISSPSLSVPQHSLKADKDPQQRVKEPAANLDDQKRKMEHTSPLTDTGLDTGSSSKDGRPGGELQTVRASLYENVIERRSVLVLDGDDHKVFVGNTGPQRVYAEHGGTPVSPTGLLHIPHSFETVHAVEGSKAVSESISPACLEDKAMTLSSRRSDYNRTSAAAGSAPEHQQAQVQGEATSVSRPEVQPRYLRVGALPKWNATDTDQEHGAEEKQLTLDSNGQGGEEAAPKTDDQPKPRATYFALTGQIQEPVSSGDSGADRWGTKAGTPEDPFVRSGPCGSQGKIVPMRNPSLEEAFRKNQSPAQEPRELDGGLLWDKQVTEEQMMEVERQRDQSWKAESQKMRTGELEREMLRQVEIERHQHLEFSRIKERERHVQLAFEKESLLEQQQKAALEKEKERQRLLEREKQQHTEREKQQDLERQRKVERERERNRERQRELDKEKKQLESQMERRQQEEELERIKEMERSQLMEFERQKQAERRLKEKKEREEVDKLQQTAIQQEVERQRELERQREVEKGRRRREAQRQREVEKDRQRELERQRELVRQREEEKERQREVEKERQKELEKERQGELERQREVEKVKWMELERQREVEKGRQRELESQREVEKERQRELESQREVEKERQRELERQREKELEKGRQKQLDNERYELEKQRLKQEERRRNEELEAIEMERNQLLELEKKRLREKMAREEADKLRQVAKRQDERQRLMEKQRWESQERLALDPSPLRPKVLDLDSVLRDEQFSKAASRQGDPAARWKRPSLRAEEPYKPAVLDMDSFTSQTRPFPSREAFSATGSEFLEWVSGVRSQPLTPEKDNIHNVPPEPLIGRLSPAWVPSPQDPWELMPVEMSVDSPAMPDLPRKMGSKPIVEQLLPRQGERWSAPEKRWSGLVNEPPSSGHSPQKEMVDKSGSAQEQSWFPKMEESPSTKAEPRQRRSHGPQELSRMRSRSVSRRSTPLEGTTEVSLSRMRSRSAHREGDRPGWVKQHQHGEDEVKDTDTLVQESDSQYGTWETGLHTDDSLTSATPTSDSALSHSPGKLSPLHAPAYQGLTSEPVAPGGHFLPTPAESQTFSFPEVPTILLDTSALRSRAQLGKRRAPRSRPTRTTRQTPGPPEREGDAWRFRDYTDEKAENLQEDSDSKEQTRVVDPRSALAAVSQPQRIPLFPGMDPSALKSQLKRRSDSDTPGDGSTTSATQLSRSPKSPFLPRATRALPPPGGRENGLIDSPQWLKELKSKKRLSQYDNDDAK